MKTSDMESNFDLFDHSICKNDLLIIGCIRQWKKDTNVLRDLHYVDDITSIIIEWYQRIYSIKYTIFELDKLKVGDKFDYRDEVGRFVLATIADKSESKLKIHFIGWSTKWDTWCDYKNEVQKFAKAETISKRPAHRFKKLKKGDYVDVNPTNRHPGWKCGEIRRVDKHPITQTLISGQIQMLYEHNDKNYLYWAHADDRSEIAEFTTMTGIFK
eukprot:323135_1